VARPPLAVRVGLTRASAPHLREAAETLKRGGGGDRCHEAGLRRRRITPTNGRYHAARFTAPRWTGPSAASWKVPVGLCVRTDERLGQVDS